MLSYITYVSAANEIKMAKKLGIYMVLFCFTLGG